MEIPRVQTAIRLSADLYERVRRRAKSENRSFNSYVTNVLEKATEPRIPKLPKDFKVSEELMEWIGFVPEISEEQIESDDRLKYLLEK